MALTDEGFDAPRADELLNDIRVEYESETGESPTWERDTFLGGITAATATRLGVLSEALQQLYDAGDLDNATAQSLDVLAALVGVFRREATPSRFSTVLAGSNGTVVPAGSLIENSDTGDRYELIETATIDGSTTVFFDAVELGALSAIPDKIVTPVEDWTGFSSGSLSVGEDEETDTELRRRRQRSLQAGTNATVAAIRTAVNNLTFIKSAVVVDNTSLSSASVEGLTLPAKSFAVVIVTVNEALTSDEGDELAQAIYDTAPAGIEIDGDQLSSVIGSDGFEKTIRWRLANELAVNTIVNVEVDADAGFTIAEVTPDVEDAVNDYFDNLLVGESVRRLPIFKRVAAIDGILSADVQFEEQASDVELNATELGVLGTFSVLAPGLP